jgi:DNA polymerase-3 subunit epsilon
MSDFQAFIDIINQNHFVILDTETTGLKAPCEIVQLAILDFQGDELLNTLIRPKHAIPAIATSIHGIHTEDCFNSPTWPEIKPTVLDIIGDRDIVVYNAKFDRYMMHCSDDSWGLPRTDYTSRSTWLCAMLWYAEYYGEPGYYGDGPRWQKLTDACRQRGIEINDAHQAIGDCKMTHKLIHNVIAYEAAARIARQLRADDDGGLST